jgi:hypothetical protein
MAKVSRKVLDVVAISLAIGRAVYADVDGFASLVRECKAGETAGMKRDDVLDIVRNRRLAKALGLTLEAMSAEALKGATATQKNTANQYKSRVKAQCGWSNVATNAEKMATRKARQTTAQPVVNATPTQRAAPVLKDKAAARAYFDGMALLLTDTAKKNAAVLAGFQAEAATAFARAIAEGNKTL